MEINWDKLKKAYQGNGSTKIFESSYGDSMNSIIQPLSVDLVGILKSGNYGRMYTSKALCLGFLNMVMFMQVYSKLKKSGHMVSKDDLDVFESIEYIVMKLEPNSKLQTDQTDEQICNDFIKIANIFIKANNIESDKYSITNDNNIVYFAFHKETFLHNAYWLPQLLLMIQRLQYSGSNKNALEKMLKLLETNNEFFVNTESLIPISFHERGIASEITNIFNKVESNKLLPELIKLADIRNIDKQEAIRKMKESYNKFVTIRSRHPSHDAIRKSIKTKLPIVVRFGSTKDMPNYYSINTVEAVQKSANKLLMKKCFTEQGVKTASWCFPQNREELISFCDTNIKPVTGGKDGSGDRIIVKSLNGSRGKGLYLFNNKQEVVDWFTARKAAAKNNYATYIVEKYYNYTREYRLHITADGCFYTCRKVLRSDVPEENRWYRNDSNSNWILETNPLFDRPSNWNKVCEESVKALKAVGLHIGAVDLRIQGAKHENPDFIICEINSAPSFGEITAVKYKEEISKIVDIIHEKASQ